MTTLNKTSNESKIAGPASVKPRTRKNESPLEPEEKTPAAAKPTAKAKRTARVAPKKTTPRKTVSKTPPTEKKSIISNISVDVVAKPAIAANTKSDSADETKGRVQQASSNRGKTTSNTSQSPLRYGVESGEMIADQLIRANGEVCIFWLDAMTQFRKTNLEKMVLVEEAGQMADQMARGLLAAGTGHAHNAVRQAVEIANAGISNIEGMQVADVSLFNF